VSKASPSRCGALAYTQLPISNEIMLLLGFPLGLSPGDASGMGPFLTELFPTRLRGSGQGFSYNFGHGIGALFPALVGYLSALMLLADAMSLFAVLAYGLFFSRRVCPAGGAEESWMPTASSDV
jgi:hypothetical protein